MTELSPLQALWATSVMSRPTPLGHWTETAGGHCGGYGRPHGAAGRRAAAGDVDVLALGPGHRRPLSNAGKSTRIPQSPPSLTAWRMMLRRLTSSLVSNTDSRSPPGAPSPNPTTSASTTLPPSSPNNTSVDPDTWQYALIYLVPCCTKCRAPPCPDLRLGLVINHQLLPGRSYIIREATDTLFMMTTNVSSPFFLLT
jgi:hypothetical protein